MNAKAQDSLTHSAKRVIADLRELAALTSTPEGAQRVAWGPVWKTAREWLKTKLSEVGLTQKADAAGNNWVTLRGESDKTVIIAGHLDSVPNGGWLDGTLGVVAALEALRRYSGGAKPPVTLKLVDWADEEGARFGRSLLGSSAAPQSSRTCRLPPNIVGLSSEKGFPSTSTLWVVQTSFTIIPCAQFARYFAGFGQPRTSQIPSLTQSKYSSVFMFAIEASPVHCTHKTGSLQVIRHLLTGFTCQFAKNYGVVSGLLDVSLAAQEPSPVAGAAEGV